MRLLTIPGSKRLCGIVLLAAAPLLIAAVGVVTWRLPREYAASAYVFARFNNSLIDIFNNGQRVVSREIATALLLGIAGAKLFRGSAQPR